MSIIPHFYYSADILDYDFGPNHPLKPERLRRTIELLGRYGVFPVEPGPGDAADLLRVHDAEYVEAVRRPASPAEMRRYGFGPGDNPAFPRMYEAALAYVSATARAAKEVVGGASLAFGIGGGLHHAHRAKASGFCIFDDPAIACHILRERFDRVAYVDIDLHHGDGVQWIFYDDPQVMTCSIHESGQTLFPGTGFVEETGNAFTSLNVPLVAHTTGDVWLDAFRRTVLPALAQYQPEAIVLQMGTDAHELDPLGHLRVTQQEWLDAVRLIRSLGLPIVALGGGGYNLSTVPRMWTSAILTLGSVDYADELPADLAAKWQTPTFSDPDLPFPRESGRESAEEVIAYIEANHLANLRL